MKPFWNISFRLKLALVFSFLVGFIALFIYSYFPVRLEEQSFLSLVDKTRSIAEMTAYRISPALFFDDRIAAHEALKAASQDKEIVYLVLHDNSAHVFASYNLEVAEQDRYTNATVLSDGMVEKSTMTTMTDVTHGGRSIGQLFVGVSLRGLHQQFDRSRLLIAVLSLIIAVIGIFAAFALATILTKPLSQMVNTAERIAKGDLTQRASVRSRDEVGHLAAAFNEMVANLVTAQRELIDVNKDLERRVGERTKDLERKIREQQFAEEALRKSELEYRSLFESANDAIVIFDPTSEVILEANNKACTVYGFAHEELVGMGMRMIWEDPERDRSHIQQTLSGISVKDFETHHTSKQGRTIDVLLNTSVIEFIGKRAILSVNHDFTERKRAEELMRLQSSALESAANAIVITDRDGTIIAVNPAFCEMTKYVPEEIVGKKPSLLKSGMQPQSFYDEMWRTIRAGNVWKGELVNRRKDGTLYPEEMIITPVRTAGGDISHFIAIKQNVTERRTLLDQITQIQKMESIGTLAAGVAHDFNNILGIILGYASLIERVPETIPEDVRAINSAVSRGASLVQQILMFARKTDVTVGPIDLNIIVREVVKMLSETFSRLITLTVDLGTMLPLIHADGTQLHQVILNLCVNARDAMPEGGVLTIRTETVEGNNLRHELSNATEEQYVCLSFTDNGTGMDPETLKHIFDPFFTTKEKGKGTGLGLSVVYGVMKSHHGLINVRSHPGTGSSFQLYFPVPEQTVNHSTPIGTTKLGEFRRGDETILVVEDEEALLGMLRVFLTQNGYKVMSAMDGEEALEVFRIHKDEIALVISDVGLPKLGGEQLLRRLKEINPAVKVILASGYFEPNAKSEAFLAGVKGFVQKPYDPEDILAKVRQVIEGSSIV